MHPKADRYLIALWVLLCGLMATLSLINPNHYVSIDSQYYLSFAGWLVGLDGDQYGHKSTGWDGTFPIGYPLLIGILARLTGTSLLVASKLLNGVVIGALLLIWRRRLGSRAALWMGSVLLLGGYVRILAYSWSEGVFFVVLLEWLWLEGQRTQQPTYRYAGKLLLLTLGLFLLRYVGGYVVVAYGLRALATYWRGGWPITRQRLGPDVVYGVVSVAFMVGYFCLNSLLTPSAYGGERFYETSETIWDKLYLIALAPINELLLLRDYISGEYNALVWLGLAVQIALLVWLWRIVAPSRNRIPAFSISEKSFFAVWFWTSGTYLAILFIMRLFSPFNGPNARMMAVVTLPLLMGVSVWVSRWPNNKLTRQLALWWAMLLVASWLQLLPQADFWGKMMKVLE